MPTSTADSGSGQRSVGLRVATTFPVAVHDGTRVLHCRAVELSATGVMIETGRPTSLGRADELLRVELFVANRDRPVRALARIVRAVGTRQALAFVSIRDADRLTLMEHLDDQHATRH